MDDFIRSQSMLKCCKKCEATEVLQTINNTDNDNGKPNLSLFYKKKRDKADVKQNKDE